MSHHTSYTMAGLMTGAGIMAYIKAKSVPSLLGSLVIACGYAAGGYLTHEKYEYELGHGISAASSLALTAVGFSRYTKTKKKMPGVPLMMLGAANLLGELYFLFRK
eukprot:gene659-8160_t